MANYKYVTDLLNDLRQTPHDEHILSENGEFKLKQEYAIERMNEIFGKGNWSIQNVKNELQKSTQNNTAQNLCTMTVEYTHPISGAILTTSGFAPMNFAADESVMENAFLNAVAKLGTTFGETLNMKLTNAATEIEMMPTSHKLAAVI